MIDLQFIFFAAAGFVLGHIIAQYTIENLPKDYNDRKEIIFQFVSKVVCACFMIASLFIFLIP